MNSKVVQAATFSFLNCPINELKGVFIDLNSAPQSADKHDIFLQKIPSNRHEVAATAFDEVTGHPIAYRLSEPLLKAFRDFPLLGSIALPKQGLKTGDNDRFLRLWPEISICKAMMADCQHTQPKWLPCSKGGDYRKWYGNNEYLLNWEEDGREIREFTDKSGRLLSRPQNIQYFHRPGITWTSTTSAEISMRLFPKGFAFESKGSVCFPKEEADLESLHSLLNSVPVSHLLGILSPTLDYSEGSIAAVPIPPVNVNSTKYANAMKISRQDWDAYERSWDFQSLPLLSISTDPHPTLESNYTAWIANNKQTICQMQELETENNRLFIDAYGLQDELSPEVPIEQITLTVNPAYRYGGNLSEDELWIRFRQDTIKEFLSYATGCMMGRYSLDHPGLILANAGDSLDNYYVKVGKSSDAVAFQPDRDGIIPVLDGEWFEDDIVARSREFLRVCFPASSLNTDLAFIETALGKDLRKYFCSDFYKDHLQTYKKRPIYWLVQSPT
jgi:hypothetical protein